MVIRGGKFSVCILILVLGYSLSFNWFFLVAIVAEGGNDLVIRNDYAEVILEVFIFPF